VLENKIGSTGSAASVLLQAAHVQAVQAAQFTCCYKQYKQYKGRCEHRQYCNSLAAQLALVHLCAAGNSSVAEIPTPRHRSAAAAPAD
jgi:hypothetical protein